MRVASAEHKLYDIDTQRVRGRGPREAGAERPLHAGDKSYYNCKADLHIHLMVGTPLQDCLSRGQ